MLSPEVEKQMITLYSISFCYHGPSFSLGLARVIVSGKDHSKNANSEALKADASLSMAKYMFATIGKSTNCLLFIELANITTHGLFA